MFLGYNSNMESMVIRYEKNQTWGGDIVWDWVSCMNWGSDVWDTQRTSYPQVQCSEEKKVWMESSDNNVYKINPSTMRENIVK